jgi:glycosyltransferase involved in cell wall biosynthesis
VSWNRQYPHRLYPGQQFVDAPELPPFSPSERTLSWNRPDSWIRAGFPLRQHDLVVFAHATPVQVPPYRAMLATLGGHARTVVICHNVLPHERHHFDEALVRQLLGHVDRVVVHSDAEAIAARSLTEQPVAVAVMPPHLPDGFVRSNPRSGEHRRLLFFGLVRPYKGLDLLLEALTRGPADVRLRVAGEMWPGPDGTRQLTRSLGIADRVELLPGYVAAAEVPRLFEDVDALVLPYRTATGSQATWMAFEFGVPVIATRAGHLSDTVREGIDGLVVEPEDVQALADALTRFYQPGVPERMRAEVKPVDPEPYWADYLKALSNP